MSTGTEKHVPINAKTSNYIFQNDRELIPLDSSLISLYYIYFHFLPMPKN